MQDGYGSHYRPLVSKQRFASMQRICDALDEEPALWQVYGERLRAFINDATTTLARRREAMEKLKGSTRPGYRKAERTARAKQMHDRDRVWRTRAHVCEDCGIGLTWNIARIHHIVQIQDGGSSDDDNIQLLCLNCNAKRHVRQ